MRKTFEAIQQEFLSEKNDEKLWLIVKTNDSVTPIRSDTVSRLSNSSVDPSLIFLVEGGEGVPS